MIYIGFAFTIILFFASYILGSIGYPKAENILLWILAAGSMAMIGLFIYSLSSFFSVISKKVELNKKTVNSNGSVDIHFGSSNYSYLNMKIYLYLEIKPTSDLRNII